MISEYAMQYNRAQLSYVIDGDHIEKPWKAIERVTTGSARQRYFENVGYSL